MKQIISLVLSFCLVVTAWSQKTINDPNVEARTVSGFHSIEVSGGINLYLSSGDEAVAISAKDQEMRNRIKTEVKDGVLKIYYEWKDGFKFNFRNNNPLRAYVSYKTIKKLVASGGSDIKVDGSIRTTSLDLKVSGGSDFKGKVEADVLTINQSGGSDMDISGSAKKLTVTASGGSDMDGYDLIAEVCVADANGGSDISITVTKEISAEASGGGDVNWKGAATVKSSKKSGGGDVSHRS
jgi:hypothetical protein